MMQLCDVHKIVASNEVVSVFHDKERKEQFTSFERFRAYNTNAASPSVSVVLKYNFSLIPAGLERPQEYVITVRLQSREALVKQFEAEAPSFARGRVIGYVTGNTAEIKVEYADYVVARGFIEAFDEWIRGCKSNPDIPWLTWLQRRSHLLPRIGKASVALLVIIIALQTIPSVFGGGAPAETWARFLVIFLGGFYLLVNLTNAAFEFIEESIDSYAVLSYLKLNKGDDKLVEEFGRRNRRVVLKFIAASLVSIALGVVSSKLTNLI